MNASHHKNRERGGAEIDQLKDDLVHKDAVIKALQQQYVDHIRPLLKVKERAEDLLAAKVRMEEWWVQRKDTHLERFRQTAELNLAVQALREAVDACPSPEPFQSHQDAPRSDPEESSWPTLPPEGAPHET